VRVPALIQRIIDIGEGTIKGLFTSPPRFTSMKNPEEEEEE
jgi:hypothetical protein